VELDRRRLVRVEQRAEQLADGEGGSVREAELRRGRGTHRRRPGPIAIKGRRAVLGRPVDKLLELL